MTIANFLKTPIFIVLIEDLRWLLILLFETKTSTPICLEMFESASSSNETWFTKYKYTIKDKMFEIK